MPSVVLVLVQLEKTDIILIVGRRQVIRLLCYITRTIDLLTSSPGGTGATVLRLRKMLRDASFFPLTAW